MSRRLFAWSAWLSSNSAGTTETGQAEPIVLAQVPAHPGKGIGERSQVADDVRRLIADTLCLEPDEVRLDAHWLSDLLGEDDSIESLDLAFRMEKHFGLRLGLMDELREIREKVELDVWGFLTQDSLRRLRTDYPFLELDAWDARPFTHVLDLLTVGGLVNFVLSKQSKAAEAKSSRDSPTG